MNSLQILTHREKEILLLLLEGKPYKQCCDRLYISLDTFKKHVKNIYKKIEVTSRSEALIWLLRQLYPELINEERIRYELNNMLLKKAA